MDKQSTIAFILIGVILVFWLYLNSPQPTVNQPQKADSTNVFTQKDSVDLEDTKLTEAKKKKNRLRIAYYSRTSIKIEKF